MAERKTYFFSIDLHDKGNGSKVDYKKLPEVLKKIVENSSKEIIDSDGMKFKTIDVTMVGDLLHTTLDIFRYKEDYMFVRTAKQKPTGTMITRDYGTQKPEILLPGTDEKSRGIEAYTYMLIDYTTGILAIVAAMAAPTEKTICDMVELYSTEYNINLLAIPNHEGIKKIYGKNKVEINSVDVTMPIPDPVILESILGVPGRRLLESMVGDKIKATIRISTETGRGKLTNDTEDSDSLIDSIRNNLPNLSKAKINAKYEGSGTKAYNFYDENFYFPITINNSRTIDGKVVYYNSDELITIYNERLRSAFANSREYLVSMSNRNR